MKTTFIVSSCSIIFFMHAVAQTPDSCPKPPTNLVCLDGLKNTCTNVTKCVKGTFCCSDGCRDRCRDPSENNRGANEEAPRPGACPTKLQPPSGVCTSDTDECIFDGDCEGETKKCCSNNCFKECVEPAVRVAIRGKCPAPKKAQRCHMGLANQCSSDSQCSYIVGGACCFDGCRRRCATADQFPDRLETARPGSCPNLTVPQFCIADANECEFDADCYPGMKCCSDTCVKRCLYPVGLSLGSIAQITQGAASGKCPIVSASKRCHIGLAHTCNIDVECPNGSYCCFDGCRKKCLDPNKDSAGAQGGLKDGTCPILPPPEVCVSDVDECFIDWDCVGNRKCCSNGCYTVCVPPKKIQAVGQLIGSAAVQCPEPVAFDCTFSMKHLCDETKDCQAGKVCCFDGCRRRCVAPKSAPDTCPKPPVNLLCLIGLRNMCVDEASCVKGTLCCHDGCRRRCKDPSQFSRGAKQARPRPGTCPALSPPSMFCPSDFDECKFDWDCAGETKKCCSNTCYNVCIEPAVGAIENNCPAPVPSPRCHIGLLGHCSNHSDCSYIQGGLCCYDGCRRRCATASGFSDNLEVPRSGKCPILPPPEFCVADYDECQFDNDCFPGKKCCNNSCFNRCVNPAFGDIGSVTESQEKCPVTTKITTCHVGLKHTCNNDDECSNGTYCCFTGCRRQCWNPETRQSSIIDKKGTCPVLPTFKPLCASDVDECFMDYDCVKEMKCCSNGCYKICIPPADDAVTAPAAAVKCPSVTPYHCSSSLRPLCEDTNDCARGKVCCFDGCRRRCLDPKTSSTLVTDGVTVTCGKKEMQIDVEKKVLNGFKSSYLRLTDRACRAQENETHFSLVAPLMSCGTVSSHTNDAVVYSNKVEEQEVGVEGMVSRMPELTIPFSCFYTKEGVTSTFGIIPRKLKVNMNGGETTTELTLEISVFKDQDYLLPFGVRDFPLKVTLNKPLFIQLSLDSPDTRLELREEKCYATPSQNPEDDMKYYIIRERCPVDSTVNFFPAPRGMRRFSFDTFQFSGDYGTFVYLHCNLVVCNASKPSSRCSLDCSSLDFPRRRRNADDEGGEVRAGLTEGPFILKREPNASKRDDNSETGSPLNVNTVIVITMAVFCALCLSIVVYMKVKPAPKPKPDPNRETYL